MIVFVWEQNIAILQETRSFRIKSFDFFSSKILDAWKENLFFLLLPYKVMTFFRNKHLWKKATKLKDQELPWLQDIVKKPL